MNENPWRPIDEAPTDGTILEGVNYLGISSLFSLEFCEQGETVTKTWWGRERRKFKPAATYMYLALPHSGGYSRLNSRTDWEPKVWRYLKVFPCPTPTQSGARE